MVSVLHWASKASQNSRLRSFICLGKSRRSSLRTLLLRRLRPPRLGPPAVHPGDTLAMPTASLSESLPLLLLRAPACVPAPSPSRARGDGCWTPRGILHIGAAFPVPGCSLHCFGERPALSECSIFPSTLWTVSSSVWAPVSPRPPPTSVTAPGRLADFAAFLAPNAAPPCSAFFLLLRSGKRARGDSGARAQLVPRPDCPLPAPPVPPAPPPPTRGGQEGDSGPRARPAQPRPGRSCRFPEFS